MNKINWSASAEDRALAQAIAKRAVTLYKSKNPDSTREPLEIEMDIVATHLNGCRLDLARLLAFDDFNFIHDIGGIDRHIDMTTGQLTNCFRPRCALPTPPAKEEK